MNEPAPIPLSTLTQVLLDTGVLIELIRRSTTAHSRFNPEAEVFASVVALGELYHGAWNAAQPSVALAEVDNLYSTLNMLDCDLAIARRYGEMRQALWRKGKPIPDNDIWIAATASAHGLPIVTNDKHFREIDALTVVEW